MYRRRCPQRRGTRLRPSTPDTMKLTRTETLDRLARLQAVVRCTDAPAHEWGLILRPLIERGSDALGPTQLRDLAEFLDRAMGTPTSNVRRLGLLAQAEALYWEAYSWDYQS